MYIVKQQVVHAAAISTAPHNWITQSLWHQELILRTLLPSKADLPEFLFSSASITSSVMSQKQEKKKNKPYSQIS